MLSYILWNGSAELFSWSKFTLRWDGLLLILAFLICRQIMIYFHKREGKPVKDVDVLATYLILGALLGGRLGQAIFFQRELWSKPVTILFPFELRPAFHFIGIAGFSSHGAALGIMGAVWLYCLRKKPGQQYLQVLDRVAVLTTLMAVALLAGSFLNSDISGKPTASPIGTVMVRPVTRGLVNLPCCIMRNPNGQNPLNVVNVKRDGKSPGTDDGHQPILLYLFFKSGTTKQVSEEFVIGDVKNFLYDMSQYIYEPGTEPIHFTTFEEINEDIDVRVKTIGIARYPLQVFESISSLLLFVFLFWYWQKHKINLPSGRVIGSFMTVFWGLRFVYEFLADNQAPFIKGMGLNKAQVLCIPLILSGIALLILSYRKAVPRAK